MEFTKHIQTYFGALTPEEEKRLVDFFTSKSLSKDDYLVKAGGNCQYLAFVKSGILRVYNQHEEKEITQWLSNKDSLITELSSFLFNQASRWNIQAITPVELFAISKTDYEKLKLHIPRWPQIENILLAKCFAILESRVYSHLSMNSLERYEHFAQLYPDLIHEVPLHYLASMLGMSPETLSRIRNPK